ncbi:hypothetical protein FAES_3234 [Fibrella aestuarina BUZ 2]|uniref:Ig-like domain-containing protein n=1 Tax=Fibrella aestuarina BUZ 2 TaxID=1166018 RepID=I0KAU0_9BACT|nr:hypothetical protein [Fibrella aestuarina]CCH01243.1 hypothetical protein FAES_3234 [Fibrella aestuarina BUZ 2]
MKRILLFWLLASSAWAQGPRMTYTPTQVLNLTATTSCCTGYTITRTTPSTRINNLGVIEPVSTNTARIEYDATTFSTTQNLLTQSESYNTSDWAKTNVSVVSSTTIAGPLGGSVPKIVESSATGGHVVLQSSNAAGIYCWSVYAKAGERNWLWLYFGGISGGSAWFDLTNGVVGTNESGVAAQITFIANGWYRCSITKLNSAAAHTGVAFASSLVSGTGSYTGDGSSGLYVTAAQLETGAFPNTYRSTTTSSVGMVTYAKPLGLLIEEGRTNQLTFSQALTNGAWGKGAQVVVTQAAGISPFGDNNTFQLTAVAGTGNTYVRQGFSVTLGTTYTFSAYVKKVNWSYVGIRAGNTSTYANIAFNFDTQSFPTPVSGYTTGWKYVGNGWYRVWVTHTITATDVGNILAGLAISDIGNNEVRTYSGGEAVWVTGCQLEIGAFPTSYIPATGAAVTRNAEDLKTASVSWFNKYQGTILVDVTPIGALSNKGMFGFTDGTLNNRIDLRANAGQPYISVGGVNQLVPGSIGTNGFVSNRYGFTYRVGSSQLVRNGGTINTAIPTSLPTAINLFQLGNMDGNTGQTFSGYITSFRYYPLSHAGRQIQAWTN